MKAEQVDDDLRVITVAGAPRELGRAHGEELRPLIEEGIGRWLDHVTATTGTAGADYIAALLADTDFTTEIKRRTPQLWDEVRGLAEGSGQAVGAVLAYQLMDEEWWYRLGARRTGKAAEACSAVGVKRADGTALVAQNMDLPSHYDGTQVLLRLKPVEGPECMVFTPAGMLGTTGVNGRGVAVCCNSLPQLSHRASGLPVAFVVRSILNQTSRSAAAELVRETPHATGQNYLIGDPSGITDLECSARKVSEVSPAGPQQRHTNHPLANDDIDAVSAEASDMRSTTRARLDRLARDLDAKGDQAGVSDVRQALSDRSVPVCVPRGSAWITLGSLIMELSSRPVVHIAPGPPAETPYTTLRFA